VRRRSKVLLPAETDWRQILKDERDLILKFYDYRCVDCLRQDVTLHVHEIKPRSTGKDSADRANRVPICSELHERIHQVDSPRAWVGRLVQARDRALYVMGKKLKDLIHAF